MFIWGDNYQLAIAVVSAVKGDEPFLASILCHIDSRKCLDQLSFGMSELTDSDSDKLCRVFSLFMIKAIKSDELYQVKMLQGIR